MSPSIYDVLARIQRDKVALGITLYPPASADEIAIFERAIKVRLPDNVRALYRFCNGFESEEDLFRIIPLEEILAKKPDRYTGNEGDFHLAEYLTYCDMWTISINKQDAEDYAIYNDNGQSVVVLTNDFTAFLSRFLDGGVFEAAGLYEWRKELQLTRHKQFVAYYPIHRRYL